MKKIRTKAGEITVSIGIFVAHYDLNISDNDIISLADKALYASKDAGRNQTTLHTMPALFSEKEHNL